ncbi:MAG: glutathione peroxidase [Pseudomonadales bacterium]
MSGVFDFSATTIAGQPIDLSTYRGKVLLIVNTASKCGFTPQYQGLQALFEQYTERGLVVLGFPCDQFGHQEPGDEGEINSFCELNYGVSFPLFAKIEVNGKDTHPLFAHLKAQAPGILGSEGIKWNFTKFLVDREGRTIARYAPATTPAAIAKDIEKLL